MMKTEFPINEETVNSSKGDASGIFFPFSVYERQLKKISQIPKTKASLMIQLSILKDFANRLGLYEAADLIK